MDKQQQMTSTYRLAAEASCNPRTAKKAIEQGAGAIRGLTGERIAAAAERLGIVLGKDGGSR